MAKRKQAEETTRRVFCGNCCYFHRDTDGINIRTDTGEYFMGVCGQGLTPDTARKQFADKPRICNQYKQRR